MSFLSRLILKSAYRLAGKPERLPWFVSTTPEMIKNVIGQHVKKGSVLDIGCGAGLFSVYLAQEGYEVTAIDFIDEAIQLTRLNALEEGVNIKVEQADFLNYVPQKQFDLILDSGCLHCMMGTERQKYKASLLKCLAEDGDFILLHFERKHFLDWRPIGPRRLRKGQILDLFAPELSIYNYFNEVFNTSLLVGPKAQQGSYWFKRAGKGQQH